jgi:hypothetical protein
MKHIGRHDLLQGKFFFFYAYAVRTSQEADRSPRPVTELALLFYM